MLVLTRKESERILIGDGIVLTVVRIEGNKVRIGIEAAKDVPILRMEVAETGAAAAVGAAVACRG